MANVKTKKAKKTKKKRKKMDPYFAIFNGHVNDADKQARSFLAEHFTGSIEEVERIEKKHNGIMGIFKESPNIHTNAYVALVTYLVNEKR